MLGAVKHNCDAQSAPETIWRSGSAGEAEAYSASETPISVFKGSDPRERKGKRKKVDGKSSEGRKEGVRGGWGKLCSHSSF